MPQYLMMQLINCQGKEPETKADMSVSGIYKQIWSICKLKRKSTFFPSSVFLFTRMQISDC